MATVSYTTRRGEIEGYFDRTALDAWARLTSDRPVGRIRATVRAGRDRMRATLLSWLPDDLSGMRLLDAGCGTGALSVAAARRGAEVVGIDISPQLIKIARSRCPEELAEGSVAFHAGDMLDDGLGEFDWVVAMDSLIHYRPADAAWALAKWSQRAAQGVLFTFAPRTPALSVMHALGRVLPRGSRSPAIVPISVGHMQALIAGEPGLSGWRAAQTERISSGFYKSQAMLLRRQ